MKLTHEEIELFIKYKPTVYYHGMVDSYDEGTNSYIRNGKLKLSHSIDNYLLIYCIDEICDAQRDAIKKDKRYIFETEMKELINS